MSGSQTPTPAGNPSFFSVKVRNAAGEEVDVSSGLVDKAANVPTDKNPKAVLGDVVDAALSAQKVNDDGTIGTITAKADGTGSVQYGVSDETTIVNTVDRDGNSTRTGFIAFAVQFFNELASICLGLMKKASKLSDDGTSYIGAVGKASDVNAANGVQGLDEDGAIVKLTTAADGTNTGAGKALVTVVGPDGSKQGAPLGAILANVVNSGQSVDAKTAKLSDDGSSYSGSVTGDVGGAELNGKKLSNVALVVGNNNNPSTVLLVFNPDTSAGVFQSRYAICGVLEGGLILTGNPTIPTSPTDTGNYEGDTRFDDNYMYRYTGTKWVRFATDSTWTA